MGPCVRRDDCGKGENPSTCRPCESRGPYAAAGAMSTFEDGFSNLQRSWQSVCDHAPSMDHGVWVPAFAGTPGWMELGLPADADVFHQRRRHLRHLLAVGGAGDGDAGLVEGGGGAGLRIQMVEQL